MCVLNYDKLIKGEFLDNLYKDGVKEILLPKKSIPF